MRSPTSLICRPHRHLGAVALHNRVLRIMRKREQDIEREPAHRRAGVEILRHRHETHATLVEERQQTREVEQRPAQPVYLVHHHAIDPVSFNVGEQLLESGPFETRPT